MNITDKYVLFWGSIFSNFANTPYTSHDGIKFFCSEQEFMYRKAMLFEDEEIAEKILKSRDPKQVKKLGRLVKNFNNEVWDKVRYDVMYTACRSKFTKNKEANKALLSYPGKTFVEASPFDTIWGIGLGEYDYRATNPSLWLGQNLLGKVLTQLRDELIEREFVITDVSNLDGKRKYPVNSES